MHATAQLNAALAGRYRIEREIGAGGMATVYLARDLRHDRAVALKVLKPDLGAVVGVERFLSEIRVMAHLEHPNLLPLFDSGEADGLLFYVMPFVDGESVRALLDRQGPLAIENALHIAVSVASALDYAHRHGIIHRDLKPENILLQDGEPLVGDFGIALALNNASGNRLTKTGISLGTPTYMSPEQAAGDRHLDARSDVYSLGVVLYEMLTGEPPHVGTTAQAVIAKVITDKPVGARCRRGTIPEHVDAALDRALAKVPADRFPTAHEFADALAGRGVDTRAGAVTESLVNRAAGAAVGMDQRAPSATWRRRVATWGALSLAGAGIAAIGWELTRSASSVAAPVRFELTFGDSVSLAANVTGPVLALSQDGRQIAFVGVTGGRRRIYVRPVDELMARRLEGTEGGLRPAFSPDGKWIAYELQPRGVLLKVPVTGGQSTTLVSDGAGGFDWAEDGTIVFARSNGLGGLWRISSVGGEPTRIAMADSAQGERLSWPRTLPGTTTVLCNLVTTPTIGFALGNPQVVAVGPDGTIKKLGIVGTSPRHVATGHILVTRSDGTVLAAPFDVRHARITGPPVPVLEQVIRKMGGAVEMTVSRDGALAYVGGTVERQVVLVDRARHAKVLVRATGQHYASPRFSPDGRHLALQTADLEFGDVWVLDIATRAMSRITQDGHSTRPEWTSDGRQLVFWSGDPNRAALVRMMSDGSGVAETLAVGLRASDMAISPTSNTVILTKESNDQRDLYVGSLDSVNTLRLWLATPANEAHPIFSPDGKWVAFESNETGRYEVYVRSFSGLGGRYPISTIGGHGHRWLGDGRTIVYRVTAEAAAAAGVGAHLIAATVRLTPEPTVIRRDTVFSGDSIMNVFTPNFDLDVSPDGEQIAIISSPVPTSRPVVVLNWFTALRERTAQARKK